MKTPIDMDQRRGAGKYRRGGMDWLRVESWG